MSNKPQQDSRPFDISRLDLGFAQVTSTNALDIVGLQMALRTGNYSKLSDRTVCVRYPYELWVKARNAAIFLNRLKACGPKLVTDYSYKHDSLTLFWGGRQVHRVFGKNIPEWASPVVAYHRDNGLTFVSKANRLVTPFAAYVADSSLAISQLAVRSLGLSLDEGEELDDRTVRIVTYETEVFLNTEEAFDYMGMMAEMHPSLDVGITEKKIVITWGGEVILTPDLSSEEFEWLQPIAESFSQNGHKA